MAEFSSPNSCQVNKRVRQQRTSLGPLLSKFALRWISCRVFDGAV